MVRIFLKWTELSISFKSYIDLSIEIIYELIIYKLWGFLVLDNDSKIIMIRQNKD